MIRSNLCRIGFGVASCLVAIAIPANAATHYTVVPIGTFGGDTFGIGINNSGQVSGFDFDTIAGHNRA